jgi:hypothetical protein
MMNSGSEEDQPAMITARSAWSDLSHADCVWLLDYLAARDPGAFRLALAALAGTLARAGWRLPS